jgi:acetylornithine/succinyldiaminopimelate/putrescine aminotransferase
VLAHGREMGGVLATRLEQIAEQVGPSVVRETRGLGLLRGLELAPSVNAGDVRAACLERGVLVITAGGNTLRLAPPLVITEDELEEGLAVIEAVLAG